MLGSGSRIFIRLPKTTDHANVFQEVFGNMIKTLKYNVHKAIMQHLRSVASKSVFTRYCKRIVGKTCDNRFLNLTLLWKNFFIIGIKLLNLCVSNQKFSKLGGFFPARINFTV